MKGMPLPFDFEGKGVLDLDLIQKNRTFFSKSGSDLLQLSNCGGFGEPTSVLDSVTTPSRPASSSTLSSSHGGGGGSSVAGGGGASTDTAAKWQRDSTATSSNAIGKSDFGGLPTVPPSLEFEGAGGRNAEKFAMEDWASVLSESAAQEQSILRWIMGDVEDPALSNLNKALQIGAGSVFPAAEFDFNSGYTAADQMPTLPIFLNNNRSSSEKIASLSPNSASSNLPSSFKLSPISQGILHPSGSISYPHQIAFDASAEAKPPISNSSLLINQQSQNPSFFFPVSYSQQQEQSILISPPAKIQSFTGFADVGLDSAGQISKGSFIDSGQPPLFLQQQCAPQLQFLPSYLPQRHKEKPNLTVCDDFGQRATIDLLYKAAELVETGNLVLAHGILARLNHQLSPIGIPFQRAAFYCKEALQLLLHCTSNNVDNPMPNSSPFSIIFRIGAYKSFSEISPFVHFANFTCNQAVLEALESFDRIHIIDFDIAYGGQWASLIQEIALRGGGSTSVKITAIISTLIHDQLELGLIRENLIHFANDIGISLEFQVMSIDSLNSGSWFENAAIAVNLPVGSLVNYQFPMPLILKFVKQLSPTIVVSIDRGCDRTDLSFPNHVIHALHSHTNLLESIDAVNVQTDALQKIERFLIQPAIERIVMSRFRSPRKTQHWRSMFLSAGFSPVTFSNFAESQAECVIKRTPVRGFQVEKRQSSLVLCWKRKELVASSAWTC